MHQPRRTRATRPSHLCMGRVMRHEWLQTSQAMMPNCSARFPSSALPVLPLRE
jgi:hypothetical protein